MRDNKNAFSVRMKEYEAFETGRKFLPMLPVYARIDGRGFSRFTKGMDRPYDIKMSCAMIETTKYLVKETHAKLGYCQSDEISLVWKVDDYKSTIFFSGKIQKMTSVLSSLATAAFTREVIANLPDYSKRMPTFDCRVCQFPNDIEATNMILWRTADATKNAVSMAARSFYSHNELMYKNNSEMQEMMFQKGMNFNNYPAFFKQGTFVRRFVEQRTLTEAERAKYVKFNQDPDQVFDRSIIREFDMPIFSKVTNRVDVVFNGAEPTTETQNEP